MKARNKNLKLSVLSLAMVGVVSSMYVYADEEEAAALKYPTSSVEVEEIYVSQGSQKFGEYNGLNKQGGYLNGNINIRGGDAYKKNEEGNTSRWSLTGTDLGLSNRSATAGYSDQGDWGVSVGYDALQHNLAPGYQTPYQGSPGNTLFTLPGNFGTVDTAAGSSPYAGQGTRALTSGQLSAFQNMDISTTRENYSLNASKILDNNLNATFEFNHLNQSGGKLQAFAANPYSSTGPSAASGGNVLGQAVSILPMPTNYQTDTVNLALNWLGNSARLSGSYFGSFFRDGSNGVKFQTWGATSSSGSPASTIETMSTAPSNQFHQLNLSGGYDFSNKTKLVGNISIARNIQNTSSAVDPVMLLSPAPSFNGLANTSHADLKVSDQTTKDLSLSASYKFDQRNNLSQSNINNFYAVDGSNIANYPSTPLSFQKQLINLNGDYRLTSNQKVQIVYGNESIKRWCNQYAVGGNIISGSSNFPAGADCVTANSSNANNLNALYRAKVNDAVSVKLGYGVDIRKTLWNQSAIAAFSGTNPNAAPGILPNAVPGQNANDYVGFQPFFEASRTQQTTKANVNWQAAENLSFGLGGKYIYSNYPDSTYGVQNGNSWVLSLDSTLNYAEEGMISGYVTQQNGQRNMTNYVYSAGSSTSAKVNGTWNNTLNDIATTFGIGARQAGLMTGKLSLNGDVTYSLAQSQYSTNLNYIPTTTGGSALSCAVDASATPPSVAGQCGTLPTIRNAMAAIKLGASYQVDKNSRVALRYIYQHLYSSDYYYNAYQTGYTPIGVLPTNQTTGSYNVNVIAASYTYSFD